MRFKVGDVAIFAVAGSAETSRMIGEQCEIKVAGVKKGAYYFGIPSSIDCDYLIFFSDGTGTLSMDWQLRKIDPPAEPVSITRTSDIDEEITA